MLSDNEFVRSDLHPSVLATLFKTLIAVEDQFAVAVQYSSTVHEDLAIPNSSLPDLLL